MNLVQGGHGFKRFIWDGHHTVREDKAKKYYDPAELNVSSSLCVNYSFEPTCSRSKCKQRCTPPPPPPPQYCWQQQLLLAQMVGRELPITQPFQFPDFIGFFILQVTKVMDRKGLVRVAHFCDLVCRSRGNKVSIHVVEMMSLMCATIGVYLGSTCPCTHAPCIPPPPPSNLKGLSVSGHSFSSSQC